ncbi:HIT family protein [Collimonas sp.]|jgi:diadenosine tetraphosphate (Ap4A) HIT family hydrolase|uniref:HIT family protein n=1 Tax=Collimonas sp. TaxID=1963772 RepID=UPI002C612926|nr:HIT family protein [Collimonas sp.]HWW99271.1 HIT family protein [Collimonas sp.]
MTVHTADCELCSSDGGEILYRAEKFRVVLVDDAQYPGFCRVIWNEHVKEMTDLPVADRSTLMAAVCKVESVVRAVMQPEKINLASLGNMTPHLHWHVIPRYADDAHFPSPVWAEAQRQPSPATLAQRQALLGALRSAVSEQF